MSDFNDVRETYERYRSVLAAVNERNKAVVFDALAAAGVTAVTVPFDGQGDSGQISGVHCKPCEADLGKTMVTIQSAGWGGGVFERSESLAEAVENLCYGYLEHEYGGWETNDGAFGEFTLDVAARTLRLEFNARWSDYTSFEHSY